MARIIALQACRHGIGCSHLVANLAVILVQRGFRVGLLDTDPRGAGIRTLFGLDKIPEKPLEAYWWLSFGPNASILKPELREYTKTVNRKEAGIYLPPLGGQFAPKGLQFKVFPECYDQSHAHAVLQHLSRDLALDYWLIDNQPAINDDTLMGLALADMVVIMMQLDHFDFQRVAVLLDVIKHFETAKTWLVPTLVLSAIDTTSITQKIEHAYDQPVAGVLPLSEEMMCLASRDVFCLCHPTHSLTRSMIAIAHQLEKSAQAFSSPVGNLAQGKLGRSRQQPFLNLLEFPSLERRLLTIVLRQGPIAISPLVAQSGQSSDEAMTAIHHLVQQGWIVQDPTTQMVRYHTETPESLQGSE